MTLSLLTSPDGQWCVVRRGKQTAWYGLGADTLDEPVARLELPDAASELILLGPATVSNPPLLAITLTRAGETTALALWQSPKFEKIADLAVSGRWRPASVTGTRAALIAEDNRTCSVVRAAGRSLVAQLIDPAGLIDQVLPMDRQQLAIATNRRLELWDAVALRPLTQLKLQLPPPPRTVGVAAGHWWILRPEQQQILLLRLSDGRPFLHAIGAPIRAVVSHPASPWLVVVTNQGLLRLSCFAHAVAELEAPAAEAYAISPSGEEAILLGCNGFAQAPWVIRLSASAAAAGVPKAKSPLVVTTAPIAQAPRAVAAPIAAASAASPSSTEDKLREMRDRAEASSSLRGEEEEATPRPKSSLAGDDEELEGETQRRSSLLSEEDPSAAAEPVDAAAGSETDAPGDALTDDDSGENGDEDSGENGEEASAGEDGDEASAGEAPELPAAAPSGRPVRRVGVPGSGGWAPPGAGSSSGPTWSGGNPAAPRPTWPGGAAPGAAALPGRRAAWPSTARGTARPGEAAPRPAAPRGLALRPGGAMAPRMSVPSPSIVPGARPAASPPILPTGAPDAPTDPGAPSDAAAAPLAPMVPSWSLRSTKTPVASPPLPVPAAEPEPEAERPVDAASPSGADSLAESDAESDSVWGADSSSAAAAGSDDDFDPDAQPDPDSPSSRPGEPESIWNPQAGSPPAPRAAAPSAAPTPPVDPRGKAPSWTGAPTPPPQPTASSATKAAAPPARAPAPPRAPHPSTIIEPSTPNFILRGGKSMPRGGAWGEPELMSDGVTDVIAALGGAGIGDPSVPYDAGAEPPALSRGPASDEIPGPLAGASSSGRPARSSAAPVRTAGTTRPASSGSPTWMSPSTSSSPSQAPGDGDEDDDPIVHPPPPPPRPRTTTNAPPSRSWRAELVRYGTDLAEGVVQPAPGVTSNELSILARRMNLPDVARQTSVILYSAWLAGAPFVPMAQLAAVLGDAAWPEALGTGILGQLGLLRHRDGKVALRRAVADALDGRPWGAIRISGDSTVSPSPIPGRLGRISTEAWPAWHSHLGKVALVTGKLRRALVEARLAELVAVTFAPLAEYPSPWPSGTNLLVVTDEIGGITELLPELRDPPSS